MGRVVEVEVWKWTGQHSLIYCEFGRRVKPSMYSVLENVCCGRELNCGTRHLCWVLSSGPRRVALRWAWTQPLSYFTFGSARSAICTPTRIAPPLPHLTGRRLPGPRRSKLGAGHKRCSTRSRQRSRALVAMVVLECLFLSTACNTFSAATVALIATDFAVNVYFERKRTVLFWTLFSLAIFRELWEIPLFSFILF